MARNKYYYNSVTCKYEEIETNPTKVLLTIFLFLLLVIFVSIGFISIGYKYGTFQTKENTELKNQNRQLKHGYVEINKSLNDLKTKVSFVEKNDKDLFRSVFEGNVDSIPDEARTAGIGGSTNKSLSLYDGEAQEIIKDKLLRIDSLNAKIKIQIISHKQLEKAAKQFDKMLSSKPAIQPIHNKELTRLASGFGWRIHPILKVKKFHYGIDFTAKRGTPIYATGDGKVRKVKTSLGGYGKEVEIDHGFGYVSKYAHLQKFNVKLGQKVKRGDIIGEVGSTGSSTAPHLHYEIIKNGTKVNPVYYFFKDLDDQQFEEILRLASIENKSLS